MDLDTGLEISHGIKELCKKNNEIQKLFLEMGIDSFIFLFFSSLCDEFPIHTY
jgi:hypothetical protein